MLLLLLQSNLDKPFYVWGEDALLSWPGAESPIIAERDAFMARVLAATATNSNCNAPAFVAEEVRPHRAGRRGMRAAFGRLQGQQPCKWMHIPCLLVLLCGQNAV